jgi:hypothetical protein
LEEKIDLPHVVLNGKASIQNIFERLEPLFVRDGTELLRTMELYLERNKNAILIDSLAIESDKKKSFLAMITGREDGVVVRLYPKQEIEKTDGVKRILAEIAKQIVRKFPDFKTAETNLEEYLS